MSKRKIAALSALAVLVLAGFTVATGQERLAETRRSHGLKALGFKVYWSLLDDGQKGEAKEIISDFLAETAPDRLAVLSRVMRHKADVAALLTKEQRVQAGKIGAMVRKLPKEKRHELVDRLLEGTDPLDRWFPPITETPPNEFLGQS